MSRYFIDRPIFAGVIAIILMLAGILAIQQLPISQFPAIAPPAVAITVTYPGADAETMERTTTQVIEQQMKGLDHLLYFSSSSTSAGTATITLTFAQGTNPDTAQVQVQNKLQAAQALLPQEVQRQGLVVAKATQNFLMFVGLYSTNGQHDANDLSDIMASKISDPISRVSGVGDTLTVGSQYAMRIWVDPLKLQSYQLTMADVTAAVQAQNAQVSAGQIGALPAPKEQMLNATVSVQSRLQTPEQFGDIRLKSSNGGAIVRLRDVARVALGAETYGFEANYNGHPATGLGIKPAPGTNALNTVAAVKARVNEIAKTLPPDVKVVYPYDTTPFVRLSITQVVETLVEAVFLVFIVMFVFLQNFRATLIPTIAVPVVLMGTFAVLYMAGYTINTLTLFGMVLAIGLLVDDAIVVVENVERLITTEHLSPADAARKSMDQITGALIGIAMVLSAVFLPMAFFGGSTGVIYRQFSITIVSAMVLSILVALILTPALCAVILKPHDPTKHEGNGLLARFFRWFNKWFDRGRDRYAVGANSTARRWGRSLVVYAVIVAGLMFLFTRLPTGFLPDEDQGYVVALVQGPSGATKPRTDAALDLVRNHFLKDEQKNVKGVFTISGFSFAGSGQNAGLAFILLNDWKDRTGAANRAPALAGRAFGAFSQYHDALIFPIVPPPVQELGNATGFDVQLVDTGNVGHAGLLQARNMLLGMSMQSQKVMQVRPASLDDAPQLKVTVDQDKARALGLDLGTVNSTIATAWGGSYVNDFIDRGRVKRVYLEADTPYRMSPDSIGNFFVRSSTGTMAPFTAFSTLDWKQAPVQLTRYNGQAAMELQGVPKPGVSTGQALAEMQALHAKLPPGTELEPTGLSYEETAAGTQTLSLYGLSMLIVFLCLAALYESWSIPVAVILVVPLGVIGALLAATLTGTNDDIYLQVGLITTIGVSAKNAILIVEFAEERVRAGWKVFDAAMEAAKLRLRPILMTSLAFVFGVFPLAITHGAGAGGQNAIGRTVVGGMLSATILAIFFVPMFFVVVSRLFGNGRENEETPNEALEPEGGNTAGGDAAPQGA